MAGPLRQILRTLNIRQLKEVRKEFCPRVKKYDNDKNDFISRLRGSLARSIDRGEISYEDLMEFITSLLESDTRTVRTQIKHTLKEMEFTGNGAKTTKGINERFLAAEVFQALYHSLDQRNYNIIREDYRRGSHPDMIVENSSRSYLIEFKRARNRSRMEGLPTQVERYKSSVDDLKKVFVVVIVEKEKDLPKNCKKVKHAIETVKDKEKTELIIKEPEELRYELR